VGENKKSNDFWAGKVDFAINDKKWSLLIGFFVLRWYYENI